MKVFSKLLIIAFVAIFIQPSFASDVAVSNSNKKVENAKYVFYFIGDGMTAAQVCLAEAALTVPEFYKNYAKLTNSSVTKEELHLKSLNIAGLATSNAEDRYITDSAAAGTALATGSKTGVGIVSQKQDGSKLKTVAEKAKESGMKVGIVSSVSIDHATPACFYAHAASRGEYPNISDQLLTSGFDYFGGGTPNWSARAKAENSDKAKAYRDYKAKAEEKGFKVVSNREDFDKLSNNESQPVIATLEMLADEQYSGDGFALPYTIDLHRHTNENNKISLADFTAKGIELLDNKDGFFMMVEGGKIDWACHANDAATCAYEVVAFDDAIGVALEFASKHPNETLIVVTGDHDCGGLSMGFAGTGYSSAFTLLSNSKTSYAEFSTAAVNKINNGESFESLLDFAGKEFGFTNNITDGSDGVLNSTMELSNYEIEKLKIAYTHSVNKVTRDNFEDADKYKASYGGYDPFTVTCTHILNNKSGINFSSYSHTAVPVMVFAHGANANIFSGFYDNTDIPKKIIEAANLK